MELSQELLLAFPHEFSFSRFGPSSIDLPGHKQGPEWEVEEPGHEPAPVWAPSTYKGRISHLSHRTCPQPFNLKYIYTERCPALHIVPKLMWEKTAFVDSLSVSTVPHVSRTQSLSGNRPAEVTFISSIF